MSDEPLTREEIEEIVDARLRRVGFKTDDQSLDEFAARVRYFKDDYAWRKNIKMWATRSIVVAIITALALMLWEGFKMKIGKGN